jgi:hypothetical protein
MNVFSVLDEELTRHLYSNPEYLKARLLEVYTRRVREIAAGGGAVATDLAALLESRSSQCAILVNDTVFRCAVNHLWSRVLHGTQTALAADVCGAILEHAAQFIRDELTSLALYPETSRTPIESGLVVWGQGGSATQFFAAFETLVRHQYGELPDESDDDDAEQIRAGLQILRQFVPCSAAAALKHVSGVCLFSEVGRRTSTSSSSQIRISGTIFLSRKYLRDPWWVAEHVFHEALHQQMYDFIHGHSVLVDNRTIRVRSPWNAPGVRNNSNLWDTHRVLAAFHVYTYLSFYYTAVEAAGVDPAVRSSNLTMRRQCLDRAFYLSNRLGSTCRGELGEAGRGFVDWLGRLLAEMDDNWPAQNETLHFVLDRHMKESGLYLRNMPADVQRSRVVRAEIESVADAFAEHGRLGHATELRALCQKGLPVLEARIRLHGAIEESLAGRRTLGDVTLDDAVAQILVKSGEELASLAGHRIGTGSDAFTRSM